MLLPPPSGSTKLRCAVVKPFIVDNRRMKSETTASANRGKDALPSHQPLERGPSHVSNPEVSCVATNDIRSWRAILSQSKNYERFESSRIQECNSIVDRGVFTLVSVSTANAY